MQISTLRRAALALATVLLLASAASAQSFTATLAGSKERPTPNTSLASGITSATLTGNQLAVSGTFAGLTGNYRASHLHIGGPEESGGVIHSLAPTVSTDRRSGTFEAATNTFTLLPEQVTALQAGRIYVNIHSDTFTGGEVRGQLGPGVTIAAARAAGASQTVTVTGIVSRAKGRFVQFQDATGGLTIRQTAGGFFDAVAAGTIAPGTTITVTGVLTQFNGLFQINQTNATTNDLTSFTVVGQGTAPVAQDVTLAQLASSGETYESELVRVRNVTVTSTTAAFAASTNYVISDASSSTNAVGLRVVSANDTDVDGTAIPQPIATITGVVGQFDAAMPPVAGYQLQPILASDVVAGSTTAAEPTPGGGLSLGVANPARGAAAVRFSADAPGATLALYDALGRRVLTLADGAGAGAQTATLKTAGLAPGVYVLRLTAGADVLTRTVTVVR